MTGQQIVEMMEAFNVEVSYFNYFGDHMIFDDEGKCLLESNSNMFDLDDINDFVFIRFVDDAEMPV